MLKPLVKVKYCFCRMFGHAGLLFSYLSLDEVKIVNVKLQRSAIFSLFFPLLCIQELL